MKLICINNKGWYKYENNYYGFLLPGKITEIDGPQYQQEYEATDMLVDCLGDLCYNLAEMPNYGWDADSFIIADTIPTPTVEITCEFEAKYYKARWRDGIITPVLIQVFE